MRLAWIDDVADETTEENTEIAQRDGVFGIKSHKYHENRHDCAATTDSGYISYP